MIDDINRKITDNNIGIKKPNKKLKDFCINELKIKKDLVGANIKTLFVYTFLSLIYCLEHFRTKDAKKHIYKELYELFVYKENNPILEKEKYATAKNLMSKNDFIVLVCKNLYTKYCEYKNI